MRCNNCNKRILGVCDYCNHKFEVGDSILCHGGKHYCDSDCFTQDTLPPFSYADAVEDDA